MDAKGISKQKLLGVAGLGWMFDAMDVGILSFVLAALAAEWNLTSSEVGLIGSINSIGMMVGAFAFGLMADRIGRKNVFIITLLFFSIASGLSAFTTSLTVFIVLRFFIGMGLGGELPVASTLVSESVSAKERGRVVVLLESFWAGGWILAALISYFVIPGFGWRTAMLLCALPAFYALYLRLKLPDSPQFKKKEVKKSFKRQITEVWAAPYRKRTIMLWILWFCVVFSYYGMFLWLPSVMTAKGFSLIHSFKYVLIMTLAQLPGYFTVAWLIERVGRKFVLVVYLTGTAISAYFFGNAESLGLLVASGAMLSFFNLGAWGALYAYTPEQYPAVMRGAGSGMAASMGRFGGIFGPLLVGSLMARGISISMIFSIFCIAIIIGAIAVLILGKETKQIELT
ncbi:MAG: MFS transporter [Bacillus sp. (in: firmicutes)]